MIREQLGSAVGMGGGGGFGTRHKGEGGAGPLLGGGGV